MGIMEGGNVLFLNVSCGLLRNKQKGIETYGYEGKITGIKRKQDNYEGQDITRIQVKMSDGKETAIITFTEESWYAHGFFSRIHKADLSKPILLGCSNSDQNEKLSFCWIKQDGQTIKKDDTFPKPIKREFGNKQITDWAEIVKIIDGLIPEICRRIDADIQGGDMPWEKQGFNPEQAPDPTEKDPPPPTDDDLPFPVGGGSSAY